MVLVNVDGASDEAEIQLWLPLIEIALRASTTIWSPPKKILLWATSRAFGSYSWTNLILGLPAISVLWNRYNVPLCLPPSQGVRSFGLRQARYIELAKTHLQNIFTADNSGTSPAKAFRSLSRLFGLTLKPGDVVRLKRGCIFRGRLVFQGNGAEGRPIRLTAYGDGPKPEILGSIRLTGWEKHDGLAYKHIVPADTFVGRKRIYSVYEYDDGEVPVRLLRAEAIPEKPGWFFFDQETSTVYRDAPLRWTRRTRRPSGTDW
jgi:hypothetical protein